MDNLESSHRMWFALSVHEKVISNNTLLTRSFVEKLIFPVSHIEDGNLKDHS